MYDAKHFAVAIPVAAVGVLTAIVGYVYGIKPLMVIGAVAASLPICLYVNNECEWNDIRFKELRKKQGTD